MTFFKKMSGLGIENVRVRYWKCQG